MLDWNQDGQLDLINISMTLSGVKPGYYLWTGLITAHETPSNLPEKTLSGTWGEGWMDATTPITVTVLGNEMLKIWHNGSYRLTIHLVQNSKDPEKREIFYVQGQYSTKPYNPRQFLPVDRSEKPPYR